MVHPPRVQIPSRLPVERGSHRPGRGFRDLQPLLKQSLTDEDRDRLANLGTNGSRNVEGLTMTHCLPNERVVVSR